MNYDAWVIVGTKLDTKQLEKDLKNAERRLKQYEKEAEKLAKTKAKAEINLKPYEEQKRLIEEMTDESLKYAQTEKEVENLLNIEKTQLQELNAKYGKQITSLEEINTKIKENSKNQALVKNQIEETNKKINRAKGIKNIKEIIDNINKSTTNTIKKIGRWALAVLGVRSAYMFVAQSASTLAQYNEQIATDLEYIRFAMASALQPVIENLIKLAYKLLTYVSYIADAWFGVDLFANASADAMNKSAKSAEKMKKSLAGFDEMNVLNDNGTTGAMGSGANLPSVELNAPENVPIPDWVKWISENKDLIILALSGIAGALLGVQLGLKAIQGLGIGIMIAGIVMLVGDLITFINDPSWENFLNLLGSISVAIGGLMLVTGNWWGLFLVIIGAIVKLIADNWDEISKILGTIGGWISKNILEPTKKNIEIMLNNITSVIKFFISIVQAIFSTVVSIITTPFTVAFQTIGKLFGNLKTFFSELATNVKQLLDGDIGGALTTFGTAFTTLMNSLWTIAKAPINLIIGGLNALINGVNKISFDVPDWVPEIGGKKLGFNIPTIPTLAVGGVVNMPGRGVYYGGARIGERGAEGVIPLTNAQMMSELGKSIGQYVTINANITNTMNGRVISRELQKINSENDFAFNK